MHLVQTEVMEVKQQEPILRYRFRVQHVYVGDPCLRGKSFYASGVEIGEPQVGTKTIWWIQKHPLPVRGTVLPARRIAWSASRRRQGYRLVPTLLAPIQPANSRYWAHDTSAVPGYADIERYARAMERLGHTPAPRQIALLTQYAECDDEDIAIPALRMLLRVLPPAERVPYLHRFISTPRADMVESGADMWLCRLQRDWVTSRERMRLYERWMNRRIGSGPSGPQVAYEQYLLAHLKADTLEPILSSATAYSWFLDVLLAGLTSDVRSKDFPAGLLATAQVSACPHAPGAVNAGLAHLIERMHGAPSPLQRQGAAQLVALFLPLQPHQQVRLRALHKELSDTDTAARLAAVLAESEHLWPDFCSAATGQTSVGRPTVRQRESWPDFCVDNDKAYWAARVFVRGSCQACSFLRAHIRPATAVSSDLLRQLLADLDADAFTRREAASQKLSAVGPLAEPFLRRALEQTESTEVRVRLTTICEQLAAEGRALPRAVAVLAQINTPEARALLQELARGAPEAEGTRDAIRALERLAAADRAWPPKTRK
jgi:hypothetical protein